MADMEENFTSLNDLYKRIMPALRAKVSELKIRKINFVTCEDIWNYCKENKWVGKQNLKINEIVNDILNLDLLNLEIYLKKKNNLRNDEDAR